ncbi:MAG: hypothetical protein V4438_04270 [Patescibacteria group bacterium]
MNEKYEATEDGKLRCYKAEDVSINDLLNQKEKYSASRQQFVDQLAEQTETANAKISELDGQIASVDILIEEARKLGLVNE